MPASYPLATENENTDSTFQGLVQERQPCALVR